MILDFLKQAFKWFEKKKHTLFYSKKDLFFQIKKPTFYDELDTSSMC